VYRVFIESKAQKIAKVKRVVMESAMDCELQNSVNNLPDDWRNQKVPQIRAQDKKEIKLSLTEMFAPTFEDKISGIVCQLDPSEPDTTHTRPLSSILDVRDEVFDKLIKVFKQKPIWSLKDLSKQDVLKEYDPSVVQYLIQNAIDTPLKVGEGYLESKGDFVAYSTGENQTMLERVLQKQEPKEELVQDIDTNDKINFKNNINDRMNNREELIKYKLNDASEDEVQQRDLNVLLNPIYPPLARVERPIFDNLIKMNFGQTTRGSEDTFRLMGYVVNSNKNDMDMGGNIWKLFGRQSYRGSSVGEFYVSPVNDHSSDMKIYLKNEMMSKEKIRDIYALPTEVYFDSPFFSKNAYTINELPKSDFNSNYL
jgi:hypothetical protein